MALPRHRVASATPERAQASYTVVPGGAGTQAMRSPVAVSTSR